jgi:hypothetical protein
MSGATASLRLEDSSFSERNYGVPQPRKTVETTTIDDASRRFFPPDFIKIDVEGAELSVLEGARETLSKTRPTMLIEIGSEKLQGVQEYLSKYEYVLRHTSDSNYLGYHQQSELCH